MLQQKNTQEDADQRALAHLDRLLESKKVAHLLLFIGSNTIVGHAHEFALKWLQMVSHSISPHLSLDIHHMKVEGKIGMHSVASIREMLEKAVCLPFQANGKVFIIEEAERMLATSANALLKTIEEPPENTLFILTTHEPHRLLATVRSRCQVVRFMQKQREPGAFYPKLAQFHQSPFSYKLLFELCDEVQASFDAKRKACEQDHTLPSKEVQKEFNAQQKHKLEQEGEGQVSLEMQHELDLLLYDIGQFYRDDYKKNGQGIALEKVEEALSFTKLAFERSMPLKNALESCFLRIYEA